MTLSLDNNEVKFILEVLKMKRPSWWMQDKIVKTIEDSLKAEIAAQMCEHIKARYTGTKVCCGKCDSFYEEGMGFEWTKETSK